MIDLTSKCIDQWKLNDNLPTPNVIDSIGSKDGTLYGRNSEDAHQNSGNPPDLNGCFSFGGPFSVIQITLGSRWSIAFWAKGNEENPSAGFGSMVFGNADDNINFFAMLNGIKAQYMPNLSELRTWTTDTNFYNIWRFVVLTFEEIAGNRGNLELFLDGNSQGVLAPVWAIFYLKHIGAGHVTPQTNFNGWIDNFMVFNYMLTQEEIDFLYNHGLGTERLKSVARPLVGGSLVDGRKGLV